jgi:sec-independent protein translocase protein TatB
MFFGLTLEKIILLGVLAAALIGPERLPAAAESLAAAVARARSWMRDARSRLREEVGDEFDDVDWRRLDPREYDPRRIIRQALLEHPVDDLRPRATAAHPRDD